MRRRVKSGWRLISRKTGKSLGTFKTLAALKRREKQINYFKHRGE